MVKALHKAGIGVILDVVLNHTAEAGAEGPVIGLKGLANEEFYLLDAEDKTKYLDFTGCGNTVRCNDSFVTRFMVDCLTFWVREMHVDGFRFDLASALARGVDGEPVADPPIVASIEFAEALADTRLIAEPWDASGITSSATARFPLGRMERPLPRQPAAVLTRRARAPRRGRDAARG